MEQLAMKMESTVDRFGNLQLASTVEGRLDTTLCMEDPSCTLISCFYGGPQGYGITMLEELPILENPAVLSTVILRGATNEFSIKKTNPTTAGHLSWISLQEFESLGGTDPTKENVCLDLEETKNQGRWLPVNEEGEGEPIVFEDPIGSYHACLLDDNLDEVTGVPLNEIGTFEVKNVITDIQPSASPSTRTTLRLDVFAVAPGTVTCVVKTQASVNEKAAELSSGSAAPGMTAEARKIMVMQQRTKLWDYLNSEEGQLARASTEVPAAVPPSVLSVLVMNKFPKTTTVPVWCWHSAAADQKITFPETASGALFALPGENPIAKPLPSFTWPGMSFVLYIENVPDTTQSRVHLANESSECSSATYDQAIPVVQNVANNEQPIEAYMKADMTKRIVCFFELPSSLALVVYAETGKELQFSQPYLPGNAMIIDGILNSFAHRGLPISLLLREVEEDEKGQLFILAEDEYTKNLETCRPAIGIGEEEEGDTESTDDYVTRVAAIGLKDVSLLSNPIEGYTHFAMITEQDTQKLVIGKSYIICYVGSKEDSTRIFNKVGGNIPVRDIIVAIHQAPGERSNAITTRLAVESVLTGELSCMVSTRQLPKAPLLSEITGEYASDPDLPEDYTPDFTEDQILGRTLQVPADDAPANTTVEVTMFKAAVANIERQPAGVAPVVYVWCHHSRSKGMIYPNDGKGIPISLAVMTPPTFTYATADGETFPEPEGIVLAWNVSFPPILPQWKDVPDFPMFYYDRVSFTIDPPLPEGVVVHDRHVAGSKQKVGGIYPSPRPSQVSVPTEYTITAQSNYDVQGRQEVTHKLSVHVPGSCTVQSVKSTEAVVACTVQDAHNMHNDAMFLLIKEPGEDDAEILPSSFFCYPKTGSPPDGSGGNLYYSCDRAGASCCCHLWLPEKEANADGSRNLNPLAIVARVRKDECDFVEQARYEVYSMAAGKNPLLADEPTAVADENLIEFTMPSPMAKEPIQFEMKVDIDYEENCGPSAGPDAAQRCKDNMQKELVQLLGAPPDMIVVRDVRPA